MVTPTPPGYAQLRQLPPDGAPIQEYTSCPTPTEIFQIFSIIVIAKGLSSVAR